MPGPVPPPLPADLPHPEDDGAAGHLPGWRVEPISLPATTGEQITVGSGRKPTVLFCYPRIGHPDTPPLVDEWSRIPGAHGCTTEACGFRDLHAEFSTAGFDVYGLSTQDATAQAEARDRLALPFALLSDAELVLTTAWGLPTFKAAGHTLLARLTMLLQDGAIARVWYPVFPPDRHAMEVLDALRQT